MEIFEGLDLFTGADELDRHPRDALDGERSAAAGVAATNAPPKAETAAEKLARLRAKQAARVGGAYLTGSVGGDYSSSSGALPPAKGLQRYQELVRKGN